MLLLVLNWTSEQRSHLTTSRESTGASVVAIRLWKMPERAPRLRPRRTVASLVHNFGYTSDNVNDNFGGKQGKYQGYPNKAGRNWRITGENRVRCRARALFTNCVRGTCENGEPVGSLISQMSGGPDAP